MKKWQQCMTAAAIGILGAACNVKAQDATINQQNTALDPPFYRAREFSLDTFAGGSLGEQTINHISGNGVGHNGRLGVGAGANYFFTRFMGVDGDDREF